MQTPKQVVVAMCAAAIVGISVSMTAGAEVGIYLNIGPPPVRYEAVPAARAGYQWSPGYWNAKHNQHVWQAGHWERNRAGYRYAEPTWTQHDNRWQLERGHWNKGE
jgi:WXXGXW repeat (2 copies)